MLKQKTNYLQYIFIYLMQFLKRILFEILQVKQTFRSGYDSHCLPKNIFTHTL
jgi:hypothetical protein